MLKQTLTAYLMQNRDEMFISIFAHVYRAATIFFQIDIIDKGDIK